MLATIVDWAALGKVVLYSFAATVVLTALFTTDVLAPGDGRHCSNVVSVLASGACVGLLAFGLYVHVRVEVARGLRRAGPG